jgi:hypothetical protein
MQHAIAIKPQTKCKLHLLAMSSVLPVMLASERIELRVGSRSDVNAIFLEVRTPAQKKRQKNSSFQWAYQWEGVCHLLPSSRLSVLFELVQSFPEGYDSLHKKKGRTKKKNGLRIRARKNQGSPKEKKQTFVVGSCEERIEEVSDSTEEAQHRWLFSWERAKCRRVVCLCVCVCQCLKPV